MKILVVDDEQLLVKGIRFNLENEGYEVTTAENGQEAVDLARTQAFDLIILDVMMPVKSGIEACTEIRTFSDVPVIMLTARSEDSDKLAGFACGADDYVTKPFNILELKARVKALLKRAASAAAPNAVEGTRLTVGDITLDTLQHAAICRGETVTLTAKVCCFCFFCSLSSLSCFLRLFCRLALCPTLCSLFRSAFSRFVLCRFLGCLCRLGGFLGFFACSAFSSLTVRL